MYTESMIYATYINNDRGEERFEKWASCPGYVIRSNSAGFQWKQLCDCCPHPSFPYLQVSYNLKV